MCSTSIFFRPSGERTSSGPVRLKNCLNKLLAQAGTWFVHVSPPQILPRTWSPCLVRQARCQTSVAKRDRSWLTQRLCLSRPLAASWHNVVAEEHHRVGHGGFPERALSCFSLSFSFFVCVLSVSNSMPMSPQRFNFKCHGLGTRVWERENVLLFLLQWGPHPSPV